MNIVKNIKKNTIVLILITIGVLYAVLKDDLKDIIKVFQTIDVRYIVIAFLFFTLSLSLKGYINYKIANNKEKFSISEAIKHIWISQFFNGVTPFSTGGQPMEIYMLTEHDFSVAKATNQTIQSFIFYQIALVICGTVAVLYNFLFHIFPKVKLLQKLVLLGFAINIAVVIVLLLISYSKSMMKRLSKLFYKIAKKMKVKTTEEEINKKFEDYYHGFQELKKRKNLFITGILLNIASLLCLYMIPLLVLYSMGNFRDLTAINSITASAYVYVIGAFVPIPGASGGIEYGFTQFFGNFINTTQLAAVLLIWRFITYYFGMLVGAILFNMDKKVKQ